MRIQGDLATYEFSDLLQWLAQGNKTGVLTVSDGGSEYKLGFEHGRIDMSSSIDPEKRLDNYLYSKGVIDEATLARAERLREATQMMSGQVLVTLGAVSEMQLAQALRDKTEEILCELLTWERGSFEFDGGDRPEATMVPISLEVTKLLLESMHRLDQRQAGTQPDAAPPPAFGVEELGVAPPPAFVVEEPAAVENPPDATQVIDGLALAGVLDPEPPAERVAETGAEAVEELSKADLLPPYAVMAQNPGPLRRLAPYAVAVVLSLTAIVFYFVNRQASAQGVDVGPSGEPIVFTQTDGPPPSRAPIVVAEVPLPAALPAADEGVTEEALRQRYEQELAGLRKELEEARRVAEPVAREPRPPINRNPEADLPANSVMRAVSRTLAPPTAAAMPASQPPSADATDATDAATAQPLPAAEQTVELPAVEPPTPTPVTPVQATPAQLEPAPAEPAEAELASADAPAPRAAALEFSNPRLIARPAPSYPVTALRHRRGATVVMRVLVGPDGRVQEAERVGPKAGMGFDRAAEDAALASTWEPGTRNGEPTEMWAELRFDFKP